MTTSPNVRMLYDDPYFCLEHSTTMGRRVGGSDESNKRREEMKLLYCVLMRHSLAVVRGVILHYEEMYT